MTQQIAYVALLVRSYDEAIAYYTGTLGFELREDTPLGGEKRWVLIAPSGGAGTCLLLARAATPAQADRVGDQTGGRVFLFLHTDDFDRDYTALRSRGVQFLEEPRRESYGAVAVFIDLYGNRWDLLERKRPGALPANNRDEAERIRESLNGFAEAKMASDADAGRLWGQPLYGPMLFLDPGTRTLYANQPDRENLLKPHSGLYIGKVGPEFPAANTVHAFGGVVWTVIPLDNLPDNRVARARLMMHESFHRIQNDLGLPACSARNAHLDAKDGRIWLQLEWRALAVALVSWGDERSQALHDALTFRAYRRSLYPDAAAEEDRMEVHEGLAEYTGLVLDGLDTPGNRWYLAGRLKANAHRTSYCYAFAYETGPAYGLLLDGEAPDWRTGLTPASSLSHLLAHALAFEAPEPLEAAALERANAYRPAEIFAREEERAREREQALAAYRKLLVVGAVLEMPLDRVQFTFDPNQVVPLGADGNVYPTATVSAAWGTIEAHSGVRIDATFTSAIVRAPTSTHPLTGDGWTLTLKAGWEVVPGERPGCFKLVTR